MVASLIVMSTALVNIMMSTMQWLLSMALVDSILRSLTLQLILTDVRVKRFLVHRSIASRYNKCLFGSISLQSTYDRNFLPMDLLELWNLRYAIEL